MRTLTYEFIIPSGVWLVDAEDWPVISITRTQLPLRLRKPTVGQKLVRVDEALGNEGIDLQYTIMRVEVDVPDESQNPEWYVPFAAVKECLAWIRVAGQQYWVGASMSGTKSIARGSIFTAPDTYTNFGAYQTRYIVPPLAKPMWEQIGRRMASNEKPSVPEELFSEGVGAFAEDDYFQAVILFGITCEIELNAFIEDLLTRQNETVKKLYDERRYNFAGKLKTITQLFGAGKYEDHDQRFAGALCKLYDLRGSAVHRAQLLIQRRNPATGQDEMFPIDFEEMSKFLFAVKDFLEWTRAERARLIL